LKFKLSSFSIIIVFVCLSIIGASIIPLLSIQLSPTKTIPSIHVNYTWQDASAKVIEQEVTAKLEGVFNTIRGVKEISSTSNKGGGRIQIKFKKNSNMDAIRFELANLIRQSYSDLPEGVTYPSLSLNAANENTTPILSYSINANESPYYIKKYAEQFIIPKLSIISGVNQTNIDGVAPYEWVVEYNTNTLIQLQLSVDEIQESINNYLTKQDLGTGIVHIKDNMANHEVSLTLVNKPDNNINWKLFTLKILLRLVIKKPI